MRPACSRAPGDCYVSFHHKREPHTKPSLTKPSIGISLSSIPSLSRPWPLPIRCRSLFLVLLPQPASSFSSIVFDGLVRHSSFRTTHSLFLACRSLLTSFSFLLLIRCWTTPTLTSFASQPSLVNWFPQILSLHHIKKLQAHYPKRFTPSPHLIHNTGYPLEPWRVYCRDRLHALYLSTEGSPPNSFLCYCPKGEFLSPPLIFPTSASSLYRLDKHTLISIPR